MGRFPDIKVKKRDPAPTYIHTFDQHLIDHMAQGLSFHAFAGAIGVPVQTIHSWCDRHPTFADARATGEAKLILFYEKLGLGGMAGKIKNFNAATFIFTTKNKLKWSDRVMIETTDHKPITLSYDPSKLIDEVEKGNLKPTALEELKS